MSEMICPKYKECSEIGWEYCPHRNKHEKYLTCDGGLGCPACIPYEPEPKCTRIGGCLHDIGIKECICDEKPEPEGQLVYLPSREYLLLDMQQIEDVINNSEHYQILDKVKSLIELQLDTVYAAARQVDNKALADFIWNEMHWDMKDFALSKETIEQAISEYIKGSQHE